MSQKKTRKDRRDEAAEKVCRELRYQIVNYGGIGDWSTLEPFFTKWMNNAKNNKYIRP